MKGIMLLANKGAGSYIDVQYPANLSEELQLKISNIMSLFEQHRINKREPHYMEMKVKKKTSMAILYTGYSYERYVGRPNYEIVIFLSENDELSKDLEGRIRRIAHELLPQRDSPIFNNLFKDYYELLEKQELGPYWEESFAELKREQEIESKKESKKDESVASMLDKIKPVSESVETIPDKIKSIPESVETILDKIKVIPERVETMLDKIKPVSESIQEVQYENFDFEKQFDNYEKSEVVKIIHQLQLALKERNDKIKILSQQLSEQKKIQTPPSQDDDILGKQLDEQNALLEEWRKKAKDLNEKNKKLNDTVMKLTAKTNYQAKELENVSLDLEELTKQLKEKEKLDSNYKKFDQIKNENNDLKQKVEEFTKQLKEKEKLDSDYKKFDQIENENNDLKQKVEEFTKLIKEKERILESFKDIDKIKNENKTLNQTIENLNKIIVELKEFNEKAKQENNIHLDVISSLKLEIKNLKDTQSSKVEGEEKTTQQIIELKKDLKVLRRERDTYLKKIKENNLL